MEFVITTSRGGTYVSKQYLEKLDKYKLSKETFKEPYFNFYTRKEEFEVTKIEIDSIQELYELIGLLKCKVVVRELFFTPENNHIFRPSLEIDEIIE